MKNLKSLIFIGLITFGYGASSQNNQEKINQECERLIEKAISVHWNYIEGKASLTEDYNWKKKSDKVCKKATI
jgi:hypothetical protein